MGGLYCCLNCLDVLGHDCIHLLGIAEKLKYHHGDKKNEL